jgi:hypothetical protein
MNITTLPPDSQSLRSVEPTATDGTDTNPFLEELFRVMARTVSREASTGSDGGDLSLSAAEVIRAVWNGDVRAETYELGVVRAEDAHDLDGS